jgi:putative acetyltransferase
MLISKALFKITPMKHELRLRAIAPNDCVQIAKIIRQSLVEYGANKAGFAWQDPCLDDLYSFYQNLHGNYFVIVDELNGVWGGAGFSQFADSTEQAELQKMYLDPSVRGKGFGRKLIQLIEHEARKMGYNSMYIESYFTMTEALSLYACEGYTGLESPLAGSEHSACDRWLIKKLI